jgi:acyl-CoA synthetase (AMP-forming)/AMP-acid ligase II
MGSLGDDKALHLIGRSSDIINRGGVKVSGSRIEEILKEMPEISEAAACGISGSSGLEEIWIGVVANGSIDVERIKSHLHAHDDIRIAPDEVILLDEIPRGELGKVQKPRLKELLLGIKRGR